MTENDTMDVLTGFGILLALVLFVACLCLFARKAR